MAERRMFAKTIIDSDAFLDMPMSAQALYFHLSMRADDEGFINNPKKIQRMIGATEDDLKILITKNFIIPFESGIVVIKHWKIHNYIRADRLIRTKYVEERETLEVKDNGTYTILEDIKEIDALDSKDLRKIAYKNSSLPYSFGYKIKRAFDGCECPICNKKMHSCYKTTQPTVQHNKPISQGGTHELENISIICESCNTSIRDRETGKLNNGEVIKIWDTIKRFENNNIKWFDNPNLLWQSTDGQLSDTRQTTDGIGKDSIGKDSIGKVSIGKSSLDKAMYTTPKEDQNHIFGEYKHVRLTDKELQKLKDEFGEVETDEAIVFLDEYIEMKGYKAKSHYLAIRKWVFDAVREDKARKAPKSQKAQELDDFYNMAKAWAERED